MKTIIAVLLAFPAVLFSQVIPPDFGEEYVIMANDKKMEIDIQDVDREYIYYEIGGRENKIPISTVKAWKMAELWAVPFTYDEDDKIRFSQVVELPGADKNEIYGRARKALTHGFVDSREVIKLDDKDNGIIIGEGTCDIMSFKYWFTITIEAKDEKYRLTIDRIYYYNTVNTVKTPKDRLYLEERFPKGDPLPRFNRGVKKNILLTFQQIFDGINASMKKKLSSDW